VCWPEFHTPQTAALSLSALAERYLLRDALPERPGEILRQLHQGKEQDPAVPGRAKARRLKRAAAEFRSCTNKVRRRSGTAGVPTALCYRFFACPRCSLRATGAGAWHVAGKVIRKAGKGRPVNGLLRTLPTPGAVSGRTVSARPLSAGLACVGVCILPLASIW